MSGQNLEQVKEQLRIKTARLKKLDAEKTRQDMKIKHLMTVSAKKLEALRGQLAEKDEQIRYQQSIRASQVKEPVQQNKTFSVESDPKKKNKEKQVPYVPIQIQVHDKIQEALKQFKDKNRSLLKRVEQERHKVGRLMREKAILSKEVRRLRNDPNTMDQIQDQVEKLETQNEETEKRYLEIIYEKDKLIEEYENLMKDSVEGKGDVEFPTEIVDQIRDELEKIKAEKEELESELILEKKKYEVKLSHEIQNVVDSYGSRKKTVQQTRRKLAALAAEVQEENTGSAYMTTYADMTTLLLTFFVLYYSLASVNMNKFKEAILGEQQASIGLLELLDAVESKETIDVMTGLRSDNILKDINEASKNDQTEKIMEVSTDSARIVVRVPGQTLFKPGSADLNLDASRPVLNELIRIVAKYPNYKVSIQGHTDDNPILGDRYPSNWELSSARATAVLRYFIDKNIEPERLTATGYADVFPIATNDSDLGQALNRRVEFVLEKKK